MECLKRTAASGEVAVVLANSPPKSKYKIIEEFKCMATSCGALLDGSAAGEEQLITIDWKKFDGGVGDGECPSGSDMEVGLEMHCKLDYDDESELEEGNMPHWKERSEMAKGKEETS
ncbi:hypothetical protein NDU88_001813 [Pleurodeles waltl]|uniref:Uncharacterized protein n=1 Tax=Pleurodeles waltl TaxID=8319 RepID=A0AAV7W1D4_PLEWA|nr:hypothetical protein NDU88_001813 [Pleurodeles waltl]